MLSDSSNGLQEQLHTATIAAMTAQTTTAAFGTAGTYANNNINTYDIDKFEITPQAGSDAVKRIDIIYPSEYQWVAPTCTVTAGIVDLSAKYPMSCVSDCSTLPCTNTVTITQFTDTVWNDQIDVEVGAMSPATAGATGVYTVRLYTSETDTTQIIEENTISARTYLSVSYPWDLWVDWTTTAQYDRQAAAGETGEIILRMKTRAAIPVGGIMKLQFDAGFDIATGGTPKCILGHGDMPFDNAKIHDYTYSHTVANCTWDASRLLTIEMPKTAITGEFSEISTTNCSYIVLTTTGATGGAVNDGFKQPPTPGLYTVDIETSSGDTVIEQYAASVTVNGPYITQNYSVTCTMKTLTAFNGYAETFINFTPDYEIPAGYATYDGAELADLGTIELAFETYEGFDKDLGSADNVTINCSAWTGIVGKDGGDIVCTIKSGTADTTGPVPARILVSNFDAIAANTAIQINIPELPLPTTALDAAVVGVGIYTTDKDGNKVYLHQRSWLQDTDAMITNGPASTATDHSTVAATITPNTNVDELSSYEITQNIGTGTAMAVDDYFYFSFPPAFFTNWDDSDDIRLSIKDGATEKIATTPVIRVYPNAGVVAIQVKDTVGTITGATITLHNIRNPSYLPNTTVTLLAQTIIKLAGVYQKLETYSFSDLQASYNDGIITGGSFSFGVDGVGQARDQANAINTGLTASFTIHPKVAAGGSIEFTMASNYPALNLSNPVPVCASTLPNTSCIINGSTLTITGFSELPRETSQTITITGMKNPTSSGPLGNFTVRVRDSSNNTIANSSTISSGLTITAANPTGSLAINHSRDFVSSGTYCTFTLDITVDSNLYVDSEIKISFPTGFNFSSNTFICSLSDAATQYQSCTASSSTEIILTLSSHVPASGLLSVTLQNVLNPSINTSPSTYTPLVVQLKHDGTVLSESPTTGGNQDIVVTGIPVAFTVASNSVVPKNASEYATYSITLQTAYEFTTSQDLKIVFTFPTTYPDALLADGTNLVCSSEPTSTACYVSGKREITFEKFSQSTAANDNLVFTMFGIVNPSAAGPNYETGDIRIEAVDADNIVYASLSTSTFFTLSLPPKMLNMTYVYAEDLRSDSETDYIFGFNTLTQNIPSGGSIWIDWPEDYYNLFTNVATGGCVFDTETSIGSATCVQQDSTGGIRTEVSGINEIVTAPSQEIKVEIRSAPTPKNGQETDNFIIKTYDSTTQLVLERSYPGASGVSTLTFVEGDKQVNLPETTSVEVFQGTYSTPIKMEIQTASINTLTFSPSVSQGGISFVPSSLTFQGAFDTVQEFQVIVPIGITLGEYTI